ncbi:hypothetical protein KC19_12G042800 [Ceratodon purpureus]|uniref:Mannosyltransferase n=1 Tax=Ceratodon purpureus TaxID=3225 RepID=A0A8T0G3G5_CERPU|nr:hypothetical protein KC19_12G042800 [Ceratodon purpureus]
MDFRLTKRRSVPFQGLKRRSRSTSNDPEPLEQVSRPMVETTEGAPANAARVRSPTQFDDAWREESVWKVCLAVRLVNSLLVQTYFNPDEHWQALEVAHRTVFGYGHLTWEWEQGLRSYVHPLLFAAFYKILAILHLDNSWFMIKGPRVFQSVFAAVGDLYLYKLSHRLFGERAAQWALFCQLSNWFNFFCMPRTFSNCMETVLTTIALYHWWPMSKTNARVGLLTSRQLGIISAGLACVMRPTSAIIWLYVGMAHWRETSNKRQYILEDVLPIGAFCLGFMTVVDRIMYGKWTFVLVNFFKFNFLSPGGDFYGTHPWHWYFTQGLPVMAFTFLPLTLAGMWWSEQRQLSGLIAWVLAVYSTLGHKEFRFILPILPLALMFAGYAIAVLEQKWAWEGSDNTPPGFNPYRLHPNDSGSSKDEPRGFWARMTSAIHPQKGTSIVAQKEDKKLWAVFTMLLLTNLPAAFYTSLIHQRGSEAVMGYLASEAQAGRVERVLFLMPCHATPYYSSLHTNIPMRFLDCSPSDEPGYVDEADRFQAHPVSFLYAMFNGRGAEALPSHIVLFDSLEKRVSMFLQLENYVLEKRFFHAHFPVDRELQGHVLVYTRSASSSKSSGWFSF